MNSINPVNVDKSAEYHNNLQTAFRERGDWPRKTQGNSSFVE